MNYKMILYSVLLCAQIPNSIDATPLKKIASVLSGMALAFVGHRFCEYSSVYCHEAAHSIVNRLFTGDPIDFYISEPFRGPLNMLFPFGGRSYPKTDISNKRIPYGLVVLAGPVAGLTTMQIQYDALSFFECRLKGTHYDHNFLPMHFLKGLYDFAKGGHSDAGYIEDTFIEGTLKTAISTLKYLRCTFFVANALDGLLPFGNNREPGFGASIGDGQKLWAKILNRSNSEFPILSEHLLKTTAGIMLAPVILGLLHRYT